MKITIIGSGHVAYHLAKAFTEQSIKVSQIFGRNEKALHDISEELKIPYSTEFLEIFKAKFFRVSLSSSLSASMKKGILE